MSSWALTSTNFRSTATGCLASRRTLEDAPQATLLAAWRGLGDFEERASIRTWLYRIATSRCPQRPTGQQPESDDGRPPALARPARADPAWRASCGLRPYPDVLLDQLPGTEPGPEARYESAEAISLAFITALQLLPPRQRAVLVLRDVLGFRTAETADILEITIEESAASALCRARTTPARCSACHGRP